LLFSKRKKMPLSITQTRYLDELKDWSTEHKLGLVVLALLTLVYWAIIQPVFVSPLRSIPGPLHCKIDKWWLVWKTHIGIRAKAIHDIHMRYGPIVRVARNEVSISDIKEIRELYGQGTDYMKSAFYTYQLRGIPNLFTMDEYVYSFFLIITTMLISSANSRKEHANRRRIMSHLFSQASTLEFEPTIHKHIEKMLSVIKRESDRGVDSNLYERVLTYSFQQRNFTDGF
jgi:benzoate 4-monooxygenase